MIVEKECEHIAASHSERNSPPLPQATTSGTKWTPGASEVLIETWMMLAIGAVALGALITVATLVMRSKHQRSAKQTTALRDGFGPEYEKAVGDQGRSGAEEDLLHRQQRADLIQVRPLSPIEVTRYTEDWTATQAQFVDNPGAALSAADRMLGEIIAARGYPAAEFEQGASALSVDHPRAVQDYRAAHEVVLRNQRNPLPTDDLRDAMKKDEAVFHELVRG